MHAFLLSIEVDPKTVPFFNHELAATTYKYTSSFNIANGYGLFRTITGVNGGRPELVLLGSDDFNQETGEGTWKEYQFWHKPGDTSDIGGIVMPHQPRFEWQLWFSALGQIDSEYYLAHYLHKLMNNDTIAK